MADWMDEAYAPNKLTHTPIPPFTNNNIYDSIDLPPSFAQIMSLNNPTDYPNKDDIENIGNIEINDIEDKNESIFTKIANKEIININNVKNIYEKEWLKLASENGHIDAEKREEKEKIKESNEMKRVIAYLRFENCKLKEKIAHIDAELKVISEEEKEKFKEIKKLKLDLNQFGNKNHVLEKTLKIKIVTIEKLCIEGNKNRALIKEMESTYENLEEEHSSNTNKLRDALLREDDLIIRCQLSKQIVESAKSHFKNDYNSLQDKCEEKMNKQKMDAAERFKKYEIEIAELKFLNEGLKDGFEKLKCHINIQ